MKRTREQLVAQVGSELGALIAGARAVTNRAAGAFASALPELQPAAFHVARALRSIGPARPTELETAATAQTRLNKDLRRLGEPAAGQPTIDVDAVLSRLMSGTRRRFVDYGVADLERARVGLGQALQPPDFERTAQGVSSWQ